jgi:hypothetical protein
MIHSLILHNKNLQASWTLSLLSHSSSFSHGNEVSCTSLTAHCHFPSKIQGAILLTAFGWVPGIKILQFLLIPSYSAFHFLLLSILHSRCKLERVILVHIFASHLS